MTDPNNPDRPNKPDRTGVPASPDGTPASPDSTPTSPATPYGTSSPPASSPPASPYGTPTSQPSAYGAAGADSYTSAPTTKQPILSILSLVSGILGLIGAPIVFIPFVGGILGLFFPVGAVVLGFLGKSRERRAKGLWLTGIITGFAGIAIALLSLVLWSMYFATYPVGDLNDQQFG